MTHAFPARLVRWGLLAAALCVAAPPALGCGIENTVPLRVLVKEFDAWDVVASAMEACGNVTVTRDGNVRQMQPEAFATTPSGYHVGAVANGTITPLLEADTIRPLDELIAAHRQDLTANQFIRVDGRTVAIAMMVNTQHLMYRADILADLGLEVPGTWDEVLAVAERIRQSGVVDYPLGATMASGWDLAQEFVNLFLGFGGELEGPDARPQIDSAPGRRTLEMLGRITGYLDPRFLESDAEFVTGQLQRGEVAMANLWASRGAAMDDPAASNVVGQIAAAPAPRALPDGAPAATLWWDGIVIARNIPDAEAEAAFRVAVEALRPEVVGPHNDAAIWLVPGYRPTRLAAGAIATATADPTPPSYPSTPQMRILHEVLGRELPAFVTGARPAAETLAAIEAGYLAAATGAGLIGD